MASNLATIRVELIANAQKFKSNIEKASGSLKKVDKATKKTTKGSKGLSNAFRDTAGSIAAVQGPLGPVAGRISAIGAIVGRVNPAMLVLTAGFVGFGLAVTKTIKSIAAFEIQQGKLNALLKATGGAAGLVGRDIEIMAVAIGKGTLASVQGARDAAGVLLTFKSITGETFKDTLALTQDLAAVGFGTMSTAALQLGKALEEPEIGLSALRRVGVSFTKQQKDQIKVLSMTGRQMEAQTLIIKALKEQVGGAGAGAAGGLAGAYDTLKENINLFFERSIKGRQIVSALTQKIRDMNKVLERQVHTLTKLPDSADELNALLDKNTAKVITLQDELREAIKNKSKFFDSGDDKKLRASLLFQIQMLNETNEAVKEKLKLKQKEKSIVNQADDIAIASMAKQKRLSERAVEDAKATGKQLAINLEIRKVEDAIRSKLGDSAEAEEAINKILENRGMIMRDNAIANFEFHEQMQDLKTIAGQVGQSFSKVGDTILDAFLRGTQGALDFKSILRELIIEIQKTIIKTLILDKVSKFITDAITGIGSKGIKEPTMKAASGGTVQAGTPTLVGERGPELFVPGSAGSIRTNADTKGSSGGGVNIVQNLNFAVGVTNTVRAEVMNMLPAIQQSTITAVADAKQRGGKFSKAFGN